MNDKISARLKACLVVCAFLLLAIFSLIIFIGRDKKDQVVIGFVITGDADEAGWNGAHYNGINTACRKFGAKLILKENVHENTGECVKAVKELAKSGAKMIVLSSYGYPQEVKDLVSEYSSIYFFGTDYNFSAPNYTAYFARNYQGRYLSGILAGLTTQNDKIGYVAAMKSNEVNRGINAFTLGVKSVNENAKVYVTYTDTWDDESKEKEAVNLLKKQFDIDVITYHQNKTYVIDEAEKLGLYSIGYNIEYNTESKKYMTSVVCDWEQTYEEIVKDYLQGKNNPKGIKWMGIEKNVVQLTPYADFVPGQTIEKIEAAKAEILNGKDVFSGKIYDNEGILRCKDNEMMSDYEILTNMNWFVEGIVIYEKKETSKNFN